MKLLNLFIGILIGITVYLFFPPPQPTYAALNEATCATLVVNNIKAINSGAESSRLVPYWTAICKGILDHIKAAAVVTTPVTSGSSAGTYTGTIQ